MKKQSADWPNTGVNVPGCCFVGAAGTKDGNELVAKSGTKHCSSFFKLNKLN